MAPAGKGTEDPGATREAPPGTVVRDFSEVGFGFGGRWVLKTAQGSGEPEGTGFEAGSLTGVGKGQAWGTGAQSAARAGVSAVEGAVTARQFGARGWEAGLWARGSAGGGRRFVCVVICQRSTGLPAAGREASISGGLTGSTGGAVGAWDLRGALSPKPLRACASPPLPTRLQPRRLRAFGPKWRPGR